MPASDATSRMLASIDDRRDPMIRHVIDLADVNSHSANLAGLAVVAARLEALFATLGAPAEHLTLPPHPTIDSHGHERHTPLGAALRWRKPADRCRPEARRVFLGIHYDTVYPADSAFQRCTRLDADTLRGPGVTDAKGGILVLLTALEAFEQSPWHDRIRWEILLNPDEEIGSPGSAPLLAEAATRNDIGLVFEPALESGHLAGTRKGSGNFTLIVHGRSAHAGRHYDQGRNAMHLIAHAVCELAALNELLQEHPGLTLNVGAIEGGGPVNIVPDLAIARFNCRVATADQQRFVEQRLAALLEALNARDGFTAQLHGGFTAPPKPMDAKTLGLFESIRDCGRDLGLDLQWQPTGGVCDGNRLAAAGLPTLDTLGPRGRSIHSDKETLFLDSLTERAKLVALMLMRIAA